MNRRRKFLLHTDTKLHYDRDPIKLKTKKILSVLLIIGVAYFFLAGNRGIIRLVEMKTEKYRLEKELVKLEEENRRSIEEIRSLKQDLKSIERIAREDLGLVKKGEVVFRFVNSNSGPSN